MPQAPQLLKLDNKLTSQPSVLFALQFANPELHTIEQTPAVQTEVELGRVGQTTPHEPQLVVVARLVSQPSVLFALQFANPELHTIEQTPAVQTEVELGRVGQTTPHEPQLVVVARLVSHPFEVFPSQSTKPGLQLTRVQLPLTHAVVALGAVQILPQAPQLFVLVLISISHPSALFALQFLKFVLQLTIEQTPPTHAAVAFGSAHAFPHVPQFAKLVFRIVSQPLVLMPSQFAKPVKQVNEQTPAVHVVVAFKRAGQTFPQAPQLFGLESKLISQPSVAILLQFANPDVQINEHNPAEQVTVELGRTGHTFPQVPQLLISVSVGAPLSTNPSQLSSMVLQISEIEGLMLELLSSQSELFNT